MEALEVGFHLIRAKFTSWATFDWKSIYVSVE